jgi:glycosyltransferase involved in cell wall biosynthesis
VRILVANWTSRHVAGTETYLKSLLPRLRAAGHEVGYFCETDASQGRPSIVPDDVPCWSVEIDGEENAVAAVGAWAPEVVFVHGLQNPSVEARLQRLAPAVLMAHGYYGSCVSGHKTHRWPVARPCTKRFGPACLLWYYPRRCGGWSPTTLVREYRTQRRRAHLLQGYAAVVTLSEHMRTEYLRRGLLAERVEVLPAPGANEIGDGTTPLVSLPLVDAGVVPRRAWRLLFLGRLEVLKGGETLLRALPRAAAELRSELVVTFAGEGPARRRWAAQARRIEAACPAVRVEFVGWVGDADKPALFASTDLLVLPSLWPEPFGLVGLEAGQYGVPCAAFDVGGVRAWLDDGVSGHLAPGDPPTHAGLVGAIVACLHDPDILARLCAGARERAGQLLFRHHFAALLAVLERVSRGSSV